MGWHGGSVIVVHGGLFGVFQSWWFRGGLWWFSHGGFVVVHGGSWWFVVVHGGSVVVVSWWFVVVFLGGFVVVCGGFSPKISRERSCDPLFNQSQTQIHYEISFLMRLAICPFPFKEHTSKELC